MTATSRSAGQAIVETLARRGVRRFYTVPGESFLEVLDAVEQTPGLQLISTRHESGAAFMAEAEGKLTGRPAVAMGTRAVGAANLMIGVQTAWEDATPMIVLCGQVDSASLGRNAFQEVDLPTFFGPVSVHGETLHDPARAGEAAARAHWAATTARPGPAVLALPADVLAGQVPDAARELTPGRRALVGPDPTAAAEIAALLRGARRPVMILGQGAQGPQGVWEAVHDLAEHYGLGVYTAFRRQDAFRNDHPHYLGHLTLRTAPELVRPLQRADVVLALGTRLGDTTSQDFALPGPGAAVIHVDLDPRALRAPVTLAWSVRADVEAFARALLALPATPVRNWSAEHQVYLTGSTVPDLASSPGGVHPAAVIGALARHLPSDVVVTNDAGNFSVFAHRYWRFTHPRSQLGPVSGAMGYGLPAAIGAGLAEPGRPVVALAGDGGFLMTAVELETAVRHGVPVLCVVFVNRSYATIAMHQARRFARTAGTDIGAVDVAGLARALGADGLDVTAADQLDDALAAAARFDRPRVIAVHTDPDVLVPGVSMTSLLAGAGG
ncbi:MAG: thiamine pyrophosphate-binding protein [Kineosporiaceae bacterium]